MDDFKRGSREWGSKSRKDEKRKCRQKLKRQTPRPVEAESDIDHEAMIAYFEDDLTDPPDVL